MRIKSIALMAAAMAAVGAAYPVNVEVRNGTWSPAVEPETRAEVGPYGTVEVQIRDADQLQRVLSNIEQLNTLSGWPDESCLYIELPGVTEADLVVSALAETTVNDAPTTTVNAVATTATPDDGGTPAPDGAASTDAGSAETTPATDAATAAAPAGKAKAGKK